MASVLISCLKIELPLYCFVFLGFFFTADQDNITDTSSRNGAWAQREELRAVTPANQKDRAAVVQTSV